MSDILPGQTFYCKSPAGDILVARVISKSVVTDKRGTHVTHKVITQAGPRILELLQTTNGWKVYPDREGLKADYIADISARVDALIDKAVKTCPQDDPESADDTGE